MELKEIRRNSGKLSGSERNYKNLERIEGNYDELRMWKVLLENYKKLQRVVVNWKYAGGTKRHRREWWGIQNIY